MPLRLYLDTSVISALFDDASPQRRSETLAFWKRLAEFEVSTSEITRTEIEQTPIPDRKRLMLEVLASLKVFLLTAEMRSLAADYVKAGVFTARMENDALHVAAAVLQGCDVILSWNFKHLVNRSRRAAVNMVNRSAGLPMIDIVVPPEI